ncbi:MAG TPA: hypothetical protein VNV87_04435 [Acidimicrobiales bacterium]|jgi:hypothetical protein|nr:hypothetical protein [Acidimicrobiales bacterium]
MPFSDYLTFSPDKLLLRLSEIIEALSSLYAELGYTRAAEFQRKADEWANPRESSVTGRSESARYSAPTETTSLIELECREKALIEEKFFLIRLLDYADRV